MRNLADSFVIIGQKIPLKLDIVCQRISSSVDHCLLVCSRVAFHKASPLAAPVATPPPLAGLWGLQPRIDIRYAN